MSESPVNHHHHQASRLEGQKKKKKPQRGGRKPLSCLACRRHKLKCDREVPCGTCIRYRRETLCRQNPAPPKRGRTANSTRNHKEEDVRDIDTDASAGSEPPPDAESEAVDEPEGPGRASADGEVVRLRSSFHKAPGGDDDTQDTAFFLRTLGLDAKATSIPVSALPQLLAEIQSAGQPSGLWHMMEGAARRRYWETQLRSALPSRSLCDLLLNYYLDHINWIFQITHVPSFRRRYEEEFWDAAAPDRGLDFVFAALVFTIISVSALYVPPDAVELFGCPRESIRDLAHLWHRASHQALLAGDYEARPCVVQLQTFSITQFYWYATNGIDALNSRLGQAVRTAQNLGLDKDVAPSRTLEEEMRRRIWWDLVDSDTFQSICLNRPPLIRLESPGVPLPLNCNDSDMTDSSLQPRPHDEPTMMMLNIFRARFFRLMNRHLCHGSSAEDAHSYEAICKLDDEVLGITRSYPWFFQLDRDGRPPALPQPLGETLAWQNHIIRTCISTQRIRMHRPFLASRVGASWARCIEAAEDALAVYGAIRTNRSTTSRQKFLPQAYQVFSVAVTVAALLLVEGSLPIADVRQRIRDMADDLRIVEDQGCVSPVASRGRRVLLWMLRLVDMGNEEAVASSSTLADDDDADGLAAEIGFIFGGEQAARTYMQRLKSRHRMRMRSVSGSMALTTKQQQQQQRQRRSSAVEEEASASDEQETPLQDVGGTELYQMSLDMDDVVLRNLLDFDMTALMADARFE
ncbi:hypothetical protein BBK36DRAFT_1197331 [Trichoderma citrinoviride]|uniref:Zn(2)-C6 fungal-type domain-containing protein n=1 Tax=Trichoderma citrinoviride TaxID=58853 RepID=A0A2T4BE59_9HYPO|nr:hypothetical protein BBK36DRAFT_1197331 [Trichoderma citrinoviride]PTB67627.1 hypothetical protein BBK36DRAFT_1197331 [Trichoderma citrinoviride]